MGLDEACEALTNYLQELYTGWDGVSQLGRTAERLKKMYKDFCWSPEAIRWELDKQFTIHKHDYNQMLVVKGISVWTLCPHHLLPCNFKVSVGYIPDGGVMGLSKFARIAVIMGKRPTMQEQYSIELAEILDKRLKPKGLGIYVEGVHGCMMSRGVLQNTPVVTSKLKGCFLDEIDTKTEFLAVVKG